MRIVADEDHNSLLIMATPRDYQKILSSLEELDIVPLQVHVEATIVEVKLEDTLEYGIEWYFKGSPGRFSSEGAIGNVSNILTGGFSWTMVDSASDVRAVLRAFADDSLVNVLSAPSVMVLDNHTAMIQVGDEVPTISQTESTGSVDDQGRQNVIQSVQYRNTGIILNVKPRVNPGGLVTMEISQEVSDAVNTEISGPDSATIQTRKIESTVAVQSGQTVVLGGLIRDRRSEAEGGVPGLYEVPIVGALFGSTNNEATRTELVVVLTPRVITNAKDAQDITDDFRVKMQGLKDEFLIEAGVIEPPRKEGQATEPGSGQL